MRTLSLGIACLLLNLIASAQSTAPPDNYLVKIAGSEFKNKSVIPPSPEAAELGKYGNTPVGLYNGTPNINIPLYEIKGKNLSVPISLSYDASGFNPQKQATWVGLNWTLNAGGVVTRSVAGHPDMQTTYFNSTSPLILPNSADQIDYNEHMSQSVKGWKETQPDWYYYNFPGGSGRFLLKPDMTVVKRQFDMLKIQGLNPTSGESSTCTIYDGNGNKYEFTTVEMSTTMMNDGELDASQQKTYYFPSSWFLTRITAADNSEYIDFLYSSNATEQTEFSNYLQNQSVGYEATPSTPFPVAGALTTSYTPEVKIKYRRTLTSIQHYVSSKLVCTVNFSATANGRQDISSSLMPGERQLDNITVLNENNLQVKKWVFGYGYFTNSLNNFWYYKRLKLNSLQEVPTGTTTQKPSYLFTYDEDTQMPSRYSATMDHWGFANNNGSSSLVPNISLNGRDFGGGANREPHLALSKKYIINKITYPTGGYTEFEFELNAARAGLSANSPILTVGGLRVKRVTDYDFTNRKSSIKIYSYLGTDGTTSGVVKDVPVYLKTTGYQASCGVCTNMSLDAPANRSYVNVLANVVFNLGRFQGSHIGYKRVVESIVDESNNSLGKTVFEYQVGMPAGLDTDAETWTLGVDDFGNGTLLKKAVFNNGDKLLEESRNVYGYRFTMNTIMGWRMDALNVQTPFTWLIKYSMSASITYSWASQGTYCSYGGPINPMPPNSICSAGNHIQSAVYKTRYSPVLEKSITETEPQLLRTYHNRYDDLTNNYIQILRTYTYGNTSHIYPTTIEETSNAGEVVVTTNEYAGDYNLGGIVSMDAQTTGIKNLQDNNRLGALVETVQNRQLSNGTNKQYISGTVNYYQSPHLEPVAVYGLQMASPLTSFTLSTTNGTFTRHGNYQLLGNYAYDAKGNLIEMYKYLGKKTSYVWTPTHRLLAQVDNAGISEVAYAGFDFFEENSFTVSPALSASNTATGLAGDKCLRLSAGVSVSKTGLNSSKEYVVSFWKLSGSVSVTPNAGAATLQSYAPVHRGWTYNEYRIPAGATSITITGACDIDELRLYPRSAVVTSRAYVPLVGVSAEVSPTSQFVYYEYDGYNRLFYVKDDDFNIVKNFLYNFGTDKTAITASAKSLYYSAEQSTSLQKNNCSTGGGTYVTYKVPYGKYVSANSQAEANTLASNDLSSNAQAYANANGACVFWNEERFAYFQKNDCGPTQGISQCSLTGNVVQRSQIKYTVPANTYSHATSVADANALADLDIQNNGQAYANANCWCNCTGEGKKYINGTCETGTRVNSSSTYLGNNVWRCTYFYQFSDNTVSQYYTQDGSTSCPIQ